MGTEPLDLVQAQKACEVAWQRLNEAQRILPDCEHVRAWRDDIEAAKRDHRHALLARDRLLREQDPPPAEAGAWIG